MDSVTELMGSAAETAQASSSSGIPPSSSSSSSMPVKVVPRKRRESVSGGEGTAAAAAAAAASKGLMRQRRLSVGGPPSLPLHSLPPRPTLPPPPPSPTVELSGALEAFMGDTAAPAAAGPGVAVGEGVSPVAGGAATVQARAQGGNRRRQQSSIGAAPASPTVELAADLMNYLDDPVAHDAAAAAAAGAGAGAATVAVAVGSGKVRNESMGMGSLSPAPAAAAAAVHASVAFTPDAGAEVEAEEREGDSDLGKGSDDDDGLGEAGPLVMSPAAAPHLTTSPSAADAVAVAPGSAAAAAAARPPLHRIRRASVSTAAAQGNMAQGGEVNRRASLQVIMRANRRMSVATVPTAIGGGNGGGSGNGNGGSKKQPGHTRRESAAGNLRRRLSSIGSVSSGQDAVAAVAVATPSQEGEEDADFDQPEGSGNPGVAEGHVGRTEQGHEAMDESMDDMTGEDLTENIPPLAMNFDVSPSVKIEID